MAAQRNFPTTMGFFTSASGGYTYTALHAAATWMAFGLVVDVSRTINKARFFVDLTGTLASGDVSVSVYSDSAGHPGSSLGTTSTFTGGTWPADGWVEFTGLSVALTPGTQYWIVIKNNTSTPATNYVQVRHGGANSGPLAGCLSSFNTYGWTFQTTTNSGTAWTSVGLAGGCFGIRTGFADGSYMGMPISGTNNGNNYVYAGVEQGVQFTMPPAGSLVVRGASITIANVAGTPNATGYVYKLYSGSTLLATSNTIPMASVKSMGGGNGFFAAEFPSPITIAAGATVRLTLAAVSSTDGSTTGPNLFYYNCDSDSNSTPLLPMQGTLVAVTTSNGGTSFTPMANTIFSFAILLDTDGESAGSTGTVPSPNDVRLGTAVASTTGLLVVPSAANVLAGTTFDYNTTAGTATVPTAAQVLTGVSYGAAGTALTGTVTLPTASSVLTTATFGPSSGTTGTVALPTTSQVITGVGFGAGGTALTGNVTLPTVGYVQSGIQYGASGTQYTGTLATTGISLVSLQGELNTRGLTSTFTNAGVACMAATATAAANLVQVNGEAVTTSASIPISLSQTLNAARALDGVADTSLTLNDVFHAAIAGAAGQESVVGTAFSVATPTGTALRSFTLNSTTAPTSRV